ncbi:hypothetical protein Sste5346_001290 [Sporothrix stenoceras]|uniref:Ubiquitin-like domain-containing protein n=1 Tax=Sporothrix stenoceras TaxID=5173 RepID=A0ABR3ZS39_9PEZI
MAEATTATMSGANNNAAAAAAETVQETTEATSSLQPKIESAESAEAIEAAPKAAASTEAAEPVVAEKTIETEASAAAGKATETTDVAATGSLTEAVEASTSAVTGGILETPRVPPAAVLRTATSNSQALNQDDEIAPVTSATGAVVCNITLLLPTGNRHPFKIDDRYLTKRGVEVPDLTDAGTKDPFSISVYKLKELILREWREDWESRPASPSSIRLIHFGRMLDDKEQLKKYQMSPDSPNIVHMSVKPAEMMEDEEAAKGTSGGREARRREGGNGCCVIL